MSFRIEADDVSAHLGQNSAVSAESRSFAVDESMRPSFIAHDSAKANADRLLSQGALCVTSGQQPGLLTGPLYTIYKALSAAALARNLEERLGRPVVPVFWVAGDDHDFAESNHCFVPSRDGEVIRLSLRERDSAAPLTPMYREPVGEGIDAVLHELESITPDTEFRAQVLNWIGSHYVPEASVASAFAGALAELLGRFGIVVFLPTHIKAKRAMAPWILAALERAGDVDRESRLHSESLKELGKPAPIATGDGASTVLIESSLGRDRLLITKGGFQTRRAREQFSFEQLRAMLQEEPDRFSPNVLLRPVVEAALLPTIAYIAGPGEMAYLPQAEPIFRLLGVSPQVFVPRWSGRVIEHRTAKVLDKYGICVEDLSLPEGQLEARVLHDRMPADAADALRELKDSIEREYARLGKSAVQIDPSLAKPVTTAKSASMRDLAGVEKRISRQLKQQNETTVRQLANARNSLFPMGKAQERVLNVSHFLIRYGEHFLSQVFEECTGWADALATDYGGE